MKNKRNLVRESPSALFPLAVNSSLTKIASTLIVAITIACIASLNVRAAGCPGANFAQAVGSPVTAGSFPISIASADFNVDGKPDLATTNDNSANVTILLGNGSGGFTQAFGSPVAVGSGPIGLASGDFNKDGKPDLAVANSQSATVSILLGDGKGGFSVSTIAVAGSPNTIVVGDFNLDTKPDLAIANDVSNGTVTILLGNGIGGFSPAIGSPISVGSFAYSVASGDFNGDNKPDLVVTNFGGASVTILLGNGLGGFSPAAGSPISVGANPGWVTVADLNLDGKPDLAVADVKVGSNLNILLGNGSGGFVPAAGSPISIQGTPIFVTASDLNLDGKPDLALTNFNDYVILMFGDGVGGFTQATGSPVAVGSSPRTVAVADFNLDAKPDFATANATSGNATIELNTCTPVPGTLQFSAAVSAVGESGGFATISVNRIGGTNGAVSAQYATSDGTAIAGQDYTTQSGTISWTDGDGSDKTFKVPILNDAVHESNEFVNLTLSNPGGGATLGSPSTARLNITDDDPAPTISINDVSLAEGNSGMTSFLFTVSLSGASTSTVTVKYATAPGTATAGLDYQDASGTVTFAPGDTSKSVAVAVNSDTTGEADETFFVNLSTAINSPIAKAQGIGTIINDDGAPPPVIDFSQANYSVAEKLGAVTVTITRSGDTSGLASVDYTTVDGTAVQKSDFEIASGTFNFAAGETSKTVSVLINQDSYIEGPESFNLVLSNPSGAVLGQSTTTVTINDDMPESLTNPIDDPSSFVYMHYHDFLNREPDAAGLQFWTDQIAACGGDTQCIDGMRANVSAAYFLSIEFQQTGYLLHLMQRESYGTLPKYAVFMRDLQEIGRGVVVGAAGWQQTLSDNQQKFAAKWVQRPEFKTLYDGMSNDDYVNALYAHAGLLPPQAKRDSLVASLNAASMDRTGVLLEVANDTSFRQQEQNQALVLMQYFGYLRRDPDAAPDSDMSGYNFWLNKLNSFNGDYVKAEMVRAFLVSAEYRQRFGQ